ncbi:hypothetical protein LZP85_05085 [Priestia flexa]|jgi:ferredoxin-fold anticodon binding domain-containing protein|uniref:Uncharacterized protein n=1 Tax=Priestia flexa TaxID=86664 RepID=A0ABU4J175_9BACI|nr:MULTISPECIES: hypothetical protein [Bacillaceae]USY56310.1 hypothetical protein NIZ91_06570 [Bacillus sp. 1780r2a1]AQX55412.1 hypothetical protein BC359_14615 [Priestia flexa]MCA0966531.1 hypothetical protein [Priestia flexa]MCA1201598.1 hypothetical protein [Priestia flexa]MCG7312994.1 hypothetical protein [Priestia flexa]
MNEQQQFVRVRELANEIIRFKLQDRAVYNEVELRNSVELLARSIVDLANVHLKEDADPETSLKATVCKVKMVYNHMNQKAKQQGLEGAYQEIQDLKSYAENEYEQKNLLG